MHLKDFKGFFFAFKKLPIGLKQTPQEEDNLSTRDKWSIPNVSFVRRFYCTNFKHMLCWNLDQTRNAALNQLGQHL